MTARRLMFMSGAALVALVQTSWGQRVSNWRVYKIADGFPDTACVSVTLTSQGKVLATHLNSATISELDGYSVDTLPSPGTSDSRVYGSPGGQLWTVVPEGLQEFRDNAWIFHPVSEIAAAFHSGMPRPISPMPLCPVRQGLVIFLLPDRCVEFRSEDLAQPMTKVLRLAAQSKLAKFSGLTLAHDGGLWLSGESGLAKLPGPGRFLKSETEWLEYPVPEALQIHNLVEPHEDEDGGVTAVADSAASQQKMIVHFDGEHWAACSAGGQKIRHAWRGPGKTFWAATIDSLFELDDGRAELSQNEEISARQYFDVAVEPGGAFWLATSDGLFRYAPLTWRIPKPLQKLTSPVRCMSGH